MDISSPQRTLIIHTDGGSRKNPGPAAYGVAAFAGDFSGEEMVGADVEQNQYEVAVLSEYLGTATNNDAEYQGLLAGLRHTNQWVAEWKAERVIFRLDSQLVIEQVNGRWKVKQASLAPFVLKAQQLLSELTVPYVFEYVPRAQNARADALVNKCLDSQRQF